MRLLVLGGTHFLGRHVVSAALARGHDVATFTRGVSGAPPEGARALHGDRDDPEALPKALADWTPELVLDTSGQTRAAARNAAAVLGDVHGYAFVSSLNAYRGWPPGPVGREDDEATWDTGDDDAAAPGDALQPPAQPVDVVVRPDDEAGSDVEDAPRHLTFGRALAQGLERPVPLPEEGRGGQLRLLQRFGLAELLVRDRAYGVVLVHARHARVPVGGHARNERVVPDRVTQQPRRIPHHARRVARGVHGRVPVLPP